MDVVVSKYFETADDLEDALRKAKEAPQYVAAAQQSANTASNAAREAVNTAAQIVTEEDARQRAEAARMSAEAERAAGESERNTGETSRTSAESARVLAEEGRGNAESWRIHAEDLREASETERQKTFGSVLDQAAAAKDAAKASETAAAESAAAAKASENTAAAARQAAEGAKTGAETAQTGAENAKASAETAKADAETARAGAEAARTASQASETAAKASKVAAAESETKAGASKAAAQAAQQAAETAKADAVAASTAAAASETTVTESAAAAETAQTGAEAAQVAAEAAKTGAQASQEAAAGSAATAKTEADRAKTEADRAAEIATGDFIPTAQKGAANGVATLDSDGKVPAEQLPQMNYDPAGAAQVVQGNLQTHIADKGNPHGITAAQVGATNEQYVDDAVNELQMALDEYMDSTNIEIDSANSFIRSHVNNKINPHGVTKAQIGLGNVNDTADSQKSVNYANTSGNTNAVGGRAAGTVLSEIDNLKTSVANGKSQIASAISDKGVSTGAGADFGTMANNIRAIKTGPNYVDFELRADATHNASATYANLDLSGYQTQLGKPVAFDILGAYTNKKVEYTNNSRNYVRLSYTTVSFTFYYNQPSDAISAKVIVRVYFEKIQLSSLASGATMSTECETDPTKYTVDAGRF